MNAPITCSKKANSYVYRCDSYGTYLSAQKIGKISLIWNAYIFQIILFYSKHVNSTLKTFSTCNSIWFSVLRNHTRKAAGCERALLYRMTFVAVLNGNFMHVCSVCIAYDSKKKKNLNILFIVADFVFFFCRCETPSLKPITIVLIKIKAFISHVSNRDGILWQWASSDFSTDTYIDFVSAQWSNNRL